MERADSDRARRWGLGVIALLIAVGAFVFYESSRGGERDTTRMDGGIELVIDGLESGRRAPFIAAQKVFLDINSGWIVDEYAVFAIQASERLRKRVAGLDSGESLDDDATTPYYTALGAGDLQEARRIAADQAAEGEDGNRRSKYMLRFVSDIERVGGKDVVERIRGR